MKKTLFSLLTLALAFTMLAGCNRPPAKVAASKEKDKAAKHDDHDHGPGPHGGTVIEFGKWHGEFTVDHKTHEVTIYILDEEVKKPVPLTIETPLLSIKSPQFQVELKAEPEKGDPDGKSSRYVAKHVHFGKEQEFEGVFSGKVDGKAYSGDFKEEEHDHKHEKRTDKK